MSQSTESDNNTRALSVNKFCSVMINSAHFIFVSVHEN